MLNSSEIQPIQTEPEKQASKTFRSRLKNVFAKSALPSLIMLLTACKGQEVQNPQAAANEALNQPDNQIHIPERKEPGQEFLSYMDRGISLTVNVEVGDSWTLVLDKLGIPIKGYTHEIYKEVMVLPIYGQTKIEITHSDGKVEETTLARALDQLTLQPRSTIKAVAPKMEMADYDQEMGTAEPESEIASPTEPDQQ
jgi:hypothetical protein